MRMRRAGFGIVGLMAALAVSGCAGGSAVEVPVGPFDGETGPALYAQACSTCHGADLRGTDHGPPFLDRVYAPGHHADGAFLVAALAGVRSHHWDFGNMPAIRGITPEQVAAIVAYVREQQRANGIE